VRKVLLVLLGVIWATYGWGGSALAVTPFEIYEASVLNQVLKRGTLVVGTEMQFFPFEYADEKGEPVGFDMDLARLAAKELGVQIEIKDMEFTGLIPSLQGGKVDMIISGMTGTLTRAKTVSFTEPYFVTGLCVLLSEKRAAGIRDAKELNAPDRILAVKLGTTGDLITEKRFPKAKVNRFKEETACVREVVTGRADAFLYDQISLVKHNKQNPDTTRVLLKPFTYEPFAIAIRKGDFDFLNWLNMFLETIRKDGRYDELYRKHIQDLLPEQPHAQ
jgi:polar amino acid transport system substrate-binding protein